MHERLVYVAPPSSEIWAKPKSQPSSSFQNASNVSLAFVPVGTVIERTIASSLRSSAPE